MAPARLGKDGAGSSAQPVTVAHASELTTTKVQVEARPPALDAATVASVASAQAQVG
jgi:hypothetical protein